MSKPIHNWPRFWIPQGKAVPLDEHGYLRDPENEYAHFYYHGYQAQVLAQLAALPVAILLGEPGVGKSTALKDESRRLQAEGQPCLYRELNRYHSAVELIADIFDSKEMQAWKAGDHRLPLLLDSLDECSLTIPVVARSLVGQFGELPTDRLSLRLTCRTADWPEHLTGELRSLWTKEEGGADPLGVFELAPLRERDVLRAAADRGLDSVAFANEVRLKEIQPLASHPNTLNMLLGLYGKPEGLPKQRAELYRRGCETLAADPNKYRKEAGYEGALRARQRMVVAGRIAAQMIFGHRSSLWRGDDWQAEPADLVESEIVGGVEHADGQDFPVDARAIKETFECALFSGKGESRIGFAHQTYAEFLAAWYLRSRGLDAGRMLSLLLHPDDKRVPPQHAETAIWLAALDGEIFASLVDTEPLLLLRADLSDTSDEQRAHLAGTLLRAYAEKREFNREWGLYQHFRKLAHPGLAVQLRPYIVDREASPDVRSVSVEIAQACGIREMADELIAVVLDTCEAMELRVEAAYAAVELSDGNQLIRLRPIALGESGDDPEDRLKAAVIPALWPALFSAEELFHQITASQSVRCLGNIRYRPEEFVGNFTANDLIAALRWMTLGSGPYEAIESARLKDAIMAESWGRLDDSRILIAFVEVLWVCLERYESLFNRRGERADVRLEQEPEKRRRVLLALLGSLSFADDELDRVNDELTHAQIVLISDRDWLLERYRSSDSSLLKARLAGCIKLFMWQGEPTWMDAVISATCDDAPHEDAPLAESVAKWMEPVWLDSEQAQMLRSSQERQKTLRARAPKPLDPPPQARVAEALQEFEAGRKDAWLRLWQELSLPDDATCYGGCFDNVTKMPGWKRASASDRQRILTCAAAWLENKASSSKGDSLDNDAFTATYRALRLLSDERRDSLEKASAASWQAWTKRLIAYPYDQDGGGREAQIKLAYVKAPEVLLETCRSLIERDIANSQPMHRIRELAAIWDGRVASLLREFLFRPALASEQVAILLDVLLQQGDDAAFETACDWVRAKGDLALIAAKAIAAHQLKRGWKIIWSAMQSDAGFGENLMLDMAYYSHRRDNSILSSLAEPEIAELYFWLEAHFPISADPQHPSDKPYSLTGRDSVGGLRNQCVSYLAGLGSAASITALQTICERFPELDWMKHQLNQARQALREHTLLPMTPAELLAYAQRSDARLARTSMELKEAVMASLQRLQKQLQGATPLAPFLWNLEENGKLGYPKSEDRISDFVKFYLERDLPTFVIDREVQVRNLKESGMGERTDLKIEAKDAEGRSISVIIENKGCWNKELMTAMEDQLYGRYLKLNGEACGIYLVGWFRSERWKGKCAFGGTKEELLAELDAQARGLSGEKGRLSVFVLDATY